MTKMYLSLEPGTAGELVYYSGDLLKGFVNLSSDDAKRARRLYIKVYGKARTYWTTSAGRGVRYMEGEEVLINARKFIFGQFEEYTGDIPPGVHKYRFTFQLPPNLPYSLNMPYGDIEYHIKAVLDIPWGLNKEVKIPLKIISKYDLNQYPHLKQPRDIEINEEYFSFSSLRPLKVIISLPFTGYIIGQEVPFKISYFNQSSVDVERTNFSLKQKIVFSTRPEQYTKVKECENVILSLRGVRAGENNDFVSTFKIPIVIASNNTFCKVISVSYSLKIEVQTSGLRISPKASVPIFIGNLPLTFENHVENHENAPTPSPPSLSIFPSTSMASLPPPYEKEVTPPPPFEVAIQMPKLDLTAFMQSQPSSSS